MEKMAASQICLQPVGRVESDDEGREQADPGEGGQVLEPGTPPAVFLTDVQEIEDGDADHQQQDAGLGEEGGHKAGQRDPVEDGRAGQQVQGEPDEQDAARGDGDPFDLVERNGFRILAGEGREQAEEQDQQPAECLRGQEGGKGVGIARMGDQLAQGTGRRHADEPTQEVDQDDQRDRDLKGDFFAHAQQDGHDDRPDRQEQSIPDAQLVTEDRRRGVQEGEPVDDPMVADPLHDRKIRKNRRIIKRSTTGRRLRNAGG